jgi:outer membrane lipoprotein SlyB
MTTDRLSQVAGCVFAAMIAGCTAAQAPVSVRPAATSAPVAPSNNHIYVSSETPPGECYHDLGPVTYTEPFTDSVIDTDDTQLNEHLRNLAQEQYPTGLDAVINVQKNQNDAGTMVVVTGEAVTMKNQMTVECALRAAPKVIDSASRMVAGGIAGTVVGGLAGGTTTGAEEGGAIGAIGSGAIESLNRDQEQQAAQTDLDTRIAAQQARITALRTELAKLVSAKCDAEELSPADCTQRVAEIEHATGGNSTVASRTATANAVSAAGAPIVSQFDVRNRLQAQQETIDRLQHQIADIKRQSGTK